MAEHLVICYNDLSDSDNWAVAKFLLNAAAKDPSVEVVWIIEPRQVALTYPPVDRATVKEVKKLLRKYLPQYFTYPTDEENDRAAQKLLVGDELQEEQIAPFKDKLSAEEFNLVCCRYSILE
jgi:hypothetical protein